jgi:hypothetical protein
LFFCYLLFTANCALRSQTCIFKFIESFCPSSDSSEKFDTFLKTELVWKLPTVTFNWDASPPPPPPAELHSSIAELALLDPDGWARAEQALNDFFPRLSYVLSKKAGSIIENKYGPKYYVNKYEATVAFLATQSFENQDSLSARMVQARFSGYGRFSCMAMVEFMSDGANAAAGTNAPTGARKNNPDDFNSPYDRNWLLMFATIFTEDLQKQTGLNDATVNALNFWVEQCEEPASYRTPTHKTLWRSDPDRLGIKDGQGNSVEARDILPLLAYGSLRQLRDFDNPMSGDYEEDPSLFVARKIGGTKRATRSDRRLLEDEKSLSPLSPPRDRRNLLVVAAAVKAGALAYAVSSNEVEDKRQRSIGVDFNKPDSTVHFLDDRDAMRTNVVYERLSSVICSPEHTLTIEEMMGDPPPFESKDTLYDSSSITRPKNLVAPASLRGNGNFDRKYSQSTNSVRKDGDLTYRERSLQAFVYVTSSDDPSVLPGWHRLADLRAFPDRDCNQLPSQVCGAARASGTGSSSSWKLVSAQIRHFGTPGSAGGSYAFPTSGYGRRLASIKTYNINRAQTDKSVLSGYRTGTEALLRARCSTYLFAKGIAGAQKCSGRVTSWYRSSAYHKGCSDDNLELSNVADFRPVEFYLSRFVSPSPPPLPPPSTPPPAPPSPPLPSPPPSPPRFDSRDGALQFARIVQENFCDSVYILSTESRCNALAIEMHVQFELGDLSWNPPSLPPLVPNVEPPPPPPSPPSPRPPKEEQDKLKMVPVYRARLSSYYMESNASLVHTEISQLAGCTESLRDLGTTLPCRTGVNPIRCFDGERHCRTAYENALEPFVEFDFSDYDPGRFYLFAVHFKLPVQEDFGRLFFHPDPLYGGDTQANRGWKLTAYDESHHELSVQCQDWNYGSNAAEHIEGLTDVTHACLSPLATDHDYEILSGARYLRITLIGQWRQIWLDDVQIYFRRLPQAAPHPPPPPPANLPRPPLGPEQPPSPPALDAPFTFYSQLVYANWNQHVIAHEPCGMTAAACARAARQRAGATAFVLSASGCCHVLEIDASSALGPSQQYQLGEAGTGVL